MTAAQVDFALPQVIDGGLPSAKSLAEFAERAEQLGFGGLWVSELTSTTVLDPLTTLTFCAARTTRVKLGAAVLLTALRSPLHLAQETATLDGLSGGRLIVGVGLGSNRRLYRAHGLDPEGRAARFEEGLDVLTGLWEHGSMSHTGPSFELDGAQKSPLSYQRPTIPLWFGARSRPALERTVRLGQGWIGSGSEPIENFADQAATLNQFLERDGIDPSRFGVAKRVYLEVTDDEEVALDRAAEWFGRHYGKPEMGRSVAVVGSPDLCAERLDEVVRAGATTLILNPMSNECEQMEVLAAEVVPMLGTEVRTTA